MEEKETNALLNLYHLSKEYYDKNCPISKVGIIDSEAKNDVIYFFKSLFNNEKIEDLINEYYKMTYFGKEIEGFVFEKKGKTSKIKVPIFNNLYSASIGVHEYTHALNLDFDCKYNNSYKHEEVMPFLNQFLFLEFVSKKYDTQKVIESSKYFMLQEQLLRNVNEFMDLIDNGSNDKERLIEYYKYIIGSLYSLQLYEYYKMDDALFMEEYKKIYNCGYDLKHLLKYYDINFSSKENIMLVKRLLRKAE